MEGHYKITISFIQLELYEKIYLYRRLVSAKCYIDEHYAEGLNLDEIADQAHFLKTATRSLSQNFSRIGFLAT